MRHGFTFSMPKHQRSVLRTVIAGLLIMGTATSCSKSDSGVSGADLSSVVCDKSPDAALGDGKLCVDSGIRSDNLFSFSNWAGRRYRSDDFGIAEMIAIYGKDNVCQDSASGSCQVRPKARVLQSAISTMLLRGRCEGLTALGALYMVNRGPSVETFDASSIQQLNPGNEDFGNVIDYWWSTQFFEDMVRESKSSRESGVSTVLANVIDGLSSAKGVTVGIYSEGGAHSLLPIAVTKLSTDTFRIIVWDSNTPRRLNRLTINTTAKSWKYEGGRTSPNEPPKVWGGTDGTIDVTYVNTRRGKPVLNLGDQQKGNSTIFATSATSQSIEVTLETSAGEKLVARTTGNTGAIPDATITPLKNGDGDQLMITLPKSAGTYTVSLKTSAKDSTVASGVNQLTIEDGSANAFSLSSPASGEPASISVTAQSQDSGTSTFSGTSIQSSTVTASTQTSIISINARANDVVKLEPSTNNKIDASIEISSANGAVQVASIPSTENNNAIQDVTISKSENGKINLATAVASPVTIDSKKIDSIISSATKSANGDGSGFSALSSDVLNTELRASVARTSSTAATISLRVVSPIDTTAWIDFGPDLDWSKLERSAIRTIKAQTSDELAIDLEGLSPGTKYRYRVTTNINGSQKFSSYAQFVTPGESVFTVEKASSEILEASVKFGEATSSSATFRSQVSTKTAALTWLEYSQTRAPNTIRQSDSTTVIAGQVLRLATEIKGLADNESYQYRIVVSIRGVLVYSKFQEFSTATKPKAETISYKLSLDLESISETEATLVATVSAPTTGTLQVFFGTSTPTTLVRSVFISSGTNLKFGVPLTGLTAGTTYLLRAVLPVPQKEDLTSSLKITTSAADIVLQVPQVVDIGQTKATFKMQFPTRTNGRLRLEWGLDTANYEATGSMSANITTTTSEISLDTGTVMPLLPGSKYRVRAVLNGTTTSAYSIFTTAGSINDSILYRATAPTVVAYGGEFVVQWTVGLKDVPSNVTFRVFDGSTQLCTRPGSLWACTIESANPSITSVVVVSYVDGVEIARSAPTTSFAS